MYDHISARLPKIMAWLAHMAKTTFLLLQELLFVRAAQIVKNILYIFWSGAELLPCVIPLFDDTLLWLGTSIS